MFCFDSTSIHDLRYTLFLPQQCLMTSAGGYLATFLSRLLRLADLLPCLLFLQHNFHNRELKDKNAFQGRCAKSEQEIGL